MALWTEEELCILKKYYSTPERKKVYELIPNRSIGSIRRMASSLGLSDKRRNYIKRDFDREYFKKINTSEKAYWLGFIYADGYVESSLLGFRLKDKDLEHLNKFSRAIKFSGEAKIEEYQYKDSVYKLSRLTLCGKGFVESLNNWGVIQNKTLVIKFPKIQTELIAHFIRGYFDGDGSIGIYKDRGYNKVLFSIVSGNEDFINKIKEYFEEKGIGRLKVRKIHNAYELRCQSLNSIVSILDIIYKDSDDSIRLTRKYAIYSQFKQINK
ncbi:LAGLIDADG family homing endonuclease [Priestia megaterium]|uniref:LAGLIDADG family homing endonuclease n=1 Tax=Priestia megaterium TaxID=1404 RepID=UPI002E20B1CC|nr:LAGLIDADG family homing endonuclease [Priestia megaterium]